jgi:hypothetical protein
MPNFNKRQATIIVRMRNWFEYSSTAAIIGKTDFDILHHYVENFHSNLYKYENDHIPTLNRLWKLWKN